MATTVFLQNSIFTSFLLPFLLIFFVVFAILQKTKVLGQENTQINALVSFVMGLIFVAAFNYTSVVNNLVLFAVIAVVILFVALLIWTFASGEGGFGLSGKEGNKTLRIILFIGMFIAVALGVFWAFGVPLTDISNLLFSQAWSQPFWTNLIFILLIGIALALVLRQTTSGSKG